jgi:iron(III) transport system permease protein
LAERAASAVVPAAPAVPAVPVTVPVPAGRRRAPRVPDGLGAFRAVIWAALALLVLLPLAAVLEQGLRPGNLAGVLRPEVLEAGINTLFSSVLSAVLATAAGTVLAVLLDRTDLPGRNWLRAVILLPFLVPPFIGAMAWMALLAPGGIVNSLREALFGVGQDWTVFGAHGVVLVLSVHSYPLAYLVIAVALRRVPPDLEDAARVSGASTVRVLRDVTLPLMRPGVAAAFLLTVVANMSDFGIPALLGLPERYTTLTTLAYRYLASGAVANPLPMVSAIGVVLLLAALAVVLLQRRLPGGTELSSAGTARPIRLGRARWPLAALVLLGALVVCVVPLLALAAQALLPAPGVPFTFENITPSILVRAATSDLALSGLRTSAGLAVGAGAICAVLGLAVASLVVRRRDSQGQAMDAVAILPQALPGLVIAVAWLLIGPTLGIFNTPWIILGAYVMAFLALVVQAVRAPLASTPRSLEDAARLAGASPLRALVDVVWRMGLPAAVIGGVVVALTAVRELTISILLVAPGSQTLGVVIYSLQQAGDYNTASALALLVALAGIAGLSLAAWAGGRHRRAVTPVRGTAPRKEH